MQAPDGSRHPKSNAVRRGCGALLFIFAALLVLDLTLRLLKALAPQGVIAPFDFAALAVIAVLGIRWLITGRLW
jgi:hypothetical protein